MNEKLKFAFGVSLTAALLFSLGYVGVKSILKGRKVPSKPSVMPTNGTKPAPPPPDPEKVIKELVKKIAQNPNVPHLHFLLANEYKKVDKKILALLEYRKTIELNPRSKDAEDARSWIEHETVLAKTDWGENIGVQYLLSMQVKSYTSLTGSLAFITQSVALKEKQFQASATASSLTPTQQAGGAPPTGQPFPSFLPSTPMMYIPVPMTGYVQPMQPGTVIPGSPQTGPGVIVPITPPPAGFAPTTQPPAGYTPLGGK